MSSIGAYNANDPYEMLIQSMIAIESRPKARLTQEKAEHERMKGVMSDFSKTLTELQSAVKKLTDPITSLFSGKTATSDSAAFSATASDRAAIGTHSIEVQRLASADARVSRQLDRAGSALAGFQGSHTFQIEILSPVSDDPQRRVTVDVTAELTGADDAEMLDQLRVAINDAMTAAVESGAIKRTEVPAVSIVNETSGTARLTIRSATTGFDGRLGFADAPSGILSALEVDRAAVADGTSGGQTVSVGTSETDSELNSMIRFDGLTLYRSTNRITDATAGLTIDLKQVSAQGAEALAVETDTESIEAGVQEFIDKYNALITHIGRKSMVDGDAGTRGDFAGDAAIRGLRMSLRSDMIRAVDGLPGHAPEALQSLGITVERNGTLTLSDTSKLSDAVAQDPDAVHAFFGGADGIAQRIESRLQRFLGSNGLIAERQSGLDARIKRLDERVRSFDAQMTRREDSLRMQFARMQEAIAVLQGQQNYFQSYFFGY